MPGSPWRASPLLAASAAGCQAKTLLVMAKLLDFCGATVVITGHIGLFGVECKGRDIVAVAPLAAIEASLAIDDDQVDPHSNLGHVLLQTGHPEEAMAQIYRVLKPRGRLIVMFYHRDSLLYRLKYGKRSIPRHHTLMLL